MQNTSDLNRQLAQVVAAMARLREEQEREEIALRAYLRVFPDPAAPTDGRSDSLPAVTKAGMRDRIQDLEKKWQALNGEACSLEMEIGSSREFQVRGPVR
jgi:hypothetical protein